MKRNILSFLMFFLASYAAAQATYGNLSPIYVDGNVLRDVHGNVVLLHGVSDTPNPQLNEYRWGESATDADITKCTSYFTKLFTAVTKTDDGASCNVFRLCMDPLWCIDAALEAEGKPYYECFSETRMKNNTKNLYWKMILAALRKGLYVVVSAPGEGPAQQQSGDAYQQYLTDVWDVFTQNDSILKYSGQISLELTCASAGHDYLQPVLSKIRGNGFGGIVWVPAVDAQNWQGQPNVAFSTQAGQMEGTPRPLLLNNVGKFLPGIKAVVEDEAGVSLVLGSTAEYVDVDGYIADAVARPAASSADTSCWDWYAGLTQQHPAYRAYKHYWSADQGNGTFINPILNGDFPDCDIIRVGDTYYLMSTTMYIFPGATIMKSHDLVNWEYCCNPLEKIDDNDAYNLLNGKEHYAQGQWATSMKYHDGKFYVYFISYGRSGVDSGRNVLLTATDPEGEWKMQYMNEHYYDSGWMFDDGPNGDGYLYVACGIGSIYVNKLDAKTLKKISDTRVIADRDGLEGARMYHIGEYYYLYLTTGGYWRGQTIYRSKNPMGPYEEMPNLNKYGDERQGNAFCNNAIHQGGLVETQTGEWWTIMFRDAGAIGRIPYLEPVVWKDGWPMIGNNGQDVSKGSKAWKKPDVGATWPRTYLPTNDSFTSMTLGKQWGWNHNHVDDKWSLMERPGHLRLHTVNVTNNLRFARNTLTQRIMGLNAEGTSSTKNVNSYGTIKMDVSGMVEGDVAGLAVYQDPYQLLGVTVRDGQKRLVYMTARSSGSWEPTEKLGPALKSDTVYLRAIVNFSTDKSNLYYSYDNSKWTRFGDEMSMRFDLSIFVGQRFYIFNYATKQTGGYVDIDWFSTEPTFSESMFYGEELMHAYPVEEATAVSLACSSKQVQLMPGASANMTLTCTMQSGTKIDVTTGCTYTYTTPGIVKVQGGRLVGVAQGETEVTATYTDPLGNPVSVSFPVSVSYFPLSVEAFNNIIGEGTIRQATGYLLVKPVAKGMAGWHYDQGLDLSDKGRYLVMRFNRTVGSTSKPVVRLYDVNDPAATTFYASPEVAHDSITVIDLQEAAKTIDLSHIYYLGFYTPTSISLQLMEVYLSDDGVNPTAIEAVSEEPAASLLRVEYFTTDGRQVGGLQPGVTIVRKVYSDGRTQSTKIIR